MNSSNNQSEQRDRAAQAAVAEVQGGMLVGLGSGDTASRAIVALGARVKQGLRVTAVATSEKSATLARSLSIELRAPDEVDAIDLTIDGADEIDPQLRLIKGAGGAHTRERLVARASRVVIIVADAAKKVQRLGERMRLPVEILPFGARWTLRALGAEGLDPVVRAGVTSDNGNLIADCRLAAELDLASLAALLDGQPGVVDHGLFLHEATFALVGEDGGLERLQR